ncbi:Carboxylesterase [Acanthamoeba castellanii str. Neff]|uniref:Carboxylesterase n=1 Tax=Acanthamoeba castellanii (strain ATCC 30010 / Neff) TaxID=1257118 RepID=L8GWH5_ACACF|nr:Carboxylesterase [Acanthamoeba castellanii str. Neff]ELR16943.1 Carboxylesterase [Acanthamoeba castellanii str. Neff]
MLYLRTRGANFGAAGYDVVVNTPLGKLGVRTELGFQFRAPWSGVRNATVAPFTCPQPTQNNGAWAEDCLYASVYVPLSFERDRRAKRDVVVFWHGGAFRGGGQLNFIGDRLANRTPTPSWCLRTGWASSACWATPRSRPSRTIGNYNLMDQRQALLWVRDNIRALVGDPRSVTITGQSAGAISVAIHTVSPASDGLYHRATSQSGVGNSAKLLEPVSWITDTMQKVVDALG